MNVENLMTRKKLVYLFLTKKEDEVTAKAIAGYLMSQAGMDIYLDLYSRNAKKR